MSEQDLSERKNKLIDWANNKYNFLFILVLIFGIGIRLYYYSLTNGQPLWWDEADYLAYAKNLAGYPVEWTVSGQHNSIFPFVVALFFKLGLSEQLIKLIVEILPSILLIPLVYFTALKMYKDKRIAVISSFLMAVLWESLFQSMRFHVDVPALFLGLLSLYVFWTGYEKKEKPFGKIPVQWTIPLTVFLVVLTYVTRRGYFLFGAFFLIYMLCTRKISDLVKDKYNWIALGFVIVLLLIFEGALFRAPITGVVGKYNNEGIPINLLPLNVFGAFFTNYASPILSILLYLFWIGVAIALIQIALSFGYFKKSEDSSLRADLFFMISLILTLAYFILYQRDATSFGESRWYLPVLFASFIFISKSTLWISDFINKYSKHIAIILVFLLIGFGGYYQIKNADPVIRDRATSFLSVKEAGLYLKEKTNIDEAIVGYPTPQLAYYAERNVVDPEWILGKPVAEATQIEFVDALKEEREIKFLAIYVFEPGWPEWARKVNYAVDPRNGQTVIAGVEFPFAQSSINFIEGTNNLISSIKIGEITFKLNSIQKDIFVYEIVREE